MILGFFGEPTIIMIAAMARTAPRNKVIYTMIRFSIVFVVDYEL